MVSLVKSTAYQSQPVNQGSLVGGAASVMYDSTKRAFHGLAEAVSFPWGQSSFPKVEKVEKGPLYKREETQRNLESALASEALSSLVAGMEEDSDVGAQLLSTLTGKTYDENNATAFDNFVYDFLYLAEDDHDFLSDEEKNNFLEDLDKIGPGNAAILLSAAHKYAEALAATPGLRAQDIRNYEQAMKFFRSALEKLLKQHPDAHLAVVAGNLELDLSQVNPEFVSELEGQQLKEENQVKADEQSQNRKKRILGDCLIALTLGSAAVAGYNFYQSRQVKVEPKAHAPKAPEPQQLPEDMCQGPDESFCQNNLSIPRIKMPQLDKEVTQQFLNHFKEQHVEVAEETVPAASLYSTQGEILRSKVMGMVYSHQEGKFNPCVETIIVAQDQHVLDGHHRWAACKVLGQPIKVYRVNRPIQELLQTANSFAGVEHHNLHQFDFASKV